MKRTRKLILALVVVMSLLMAMAVAVIPASAATPEKLYLIPNDNWKTANARFAAYFFNSSSNKWVDMSDSDGDGVYEVTVPSGYPNVIFCRMNPSATANNWDNKWNQTGDLVIPTNGSNLYTINADSWDAGSWSTYTAAASFRGSFNGWNDTAVNVVDGRVTKTFTLEAGTYTFKVVKGVTWYGNGGTIEDTTTKTSATGWEMKTSDGDCTLKATGGTYTFTFEWSTNRLYIFWDCGSHTYTDCTDGTCNKSGCTGTREANANHIFGNDCTNTNCTVENCPGTREANANHIFGNDCTNTNCTVENCPGKREANANHIFDNDCTDGKCNVENCPGTRQANATHSYTDCTDTTCNNTGCDDTRIAPGHTGGTATCTAQAECEVCGTAYGELAAHTPNEDDGDCTTDITCSVCGTVTTEGKDAHTPAEDDGDVTTAVKCANEGCGYIFVEAKEAITLTIPTFENGAVTADKMNYAIGDTVTLTIAPASGYFQKLTIDGEPLLLGWKTKTYSFVAEKDTYVIGGSFERTLEMYAGDWGRWDNTNHAHGILSAYYPSNNDAWWIKIAGNYDSLSINAKNYREIANSYEGGPDGGWRIALYMQLDNGNYYAFSMWINTDKLYAYNHFGGNIDGVASTTGWGGAWCLLSEKNAEATAALNGDGAEFKLERIDGNHIQITFGGTVLETYEIPGATAANKVKSVGLLHYGNKGAHVDIPFELTVPCDHNTADCPHVLVGDEYKTVEDAFKSETTDNITLSKDFVVPEGGLTTGGAILLGEGVTLDLNGQHLKAAGVVNFGGAKIVGEGLIVVGENKLIGKSADYLALWTTVGEVSGYALKEVNDLYKGGPVTTGEGETNKYTVEFRPAFVDGTHFGTFKVGGHGVVFSIKITSEGMADIIVPVGADVIQKVYDEKRVMKLNLKNAALDKTYNIYLVMTSGQAEYVDSLGTITNGTYAK